MNNINDASPRVQRALAWCGPAMIALFLIGWIPLAQQGPPTKPYWSAERLTAFYIENTTSIRIGCFVMVIALTLMAPWGALMAARTRTMERGFPVFTYLQIALVGVATIVVILIPMVWAVAAFRPNDTDPDVTRMLNDVAWFLFLYSWPPFSAWYIAIAVPIFRAREEDRCWPRWVAWLNIWCAVLEFPAGLMSFFHSGALSYNGFVAMWIPLAVFFIWMCGMTYATLADIRRREPATRRARPLSPSTATGS